MLTIDGNNNIILTRGDTLTLTVELTKDGEPYTPEQADQIHQRATPGVRGFMSMVLDMALKTQVGATTCRTTI